MNIVTFYLSLLGTIVVIAMMLSIKHVVKEAWDYFKEKKISKAQETSCFRKFLTKIRGNNEKTNND